MPPKRNESTPSRRDSIVHGASLSAKGLQVRPDLSLDDWVTLGARIARLADGTAWALGDWLLFGQAAYGQRYREALALTGLEYQTLRNYAWVARRVELSRRRDSLSFAHHCEVAALEPVEQDLWLKRAEEYRWTRAELRRRLTSHRAPPVAPAASPVVLRMTVSREREERWRRVAAEHELTVDEWLATVADAAVERAVRGTLPRELPRRLHEARRDAAGGY